MSILQKIIPVFLIIALGKFLSSKNILTDSGISNIKSLCVTVLLPVMAFDALIHGTYSRNSLLLIGLEFFMLFSAWGIGFLLKRFFDRSIQDYIPYALTTYEGGLFGWALISILVEEKNLYYIVSMDIFSGVFGFTVMYIGYKIINGEQPSKKRDSSFHRKEPSHNIRSTWFYRSLCRSWKNHRRIRICRTLFKNHLHIYSTTYNIDPSFHRCRPCIQRYSSFTRN